VLGVLVEIFRRHAVAAPLRFPRKGDVSLEYLVSVAADSYVGAVAVEGLISLWRSRLLMEWPVAVEPPARTLVCS
jgi:hypothetical protein